MPSAIWDAKVQREETGKWDVRLGSLRHSSNDRSGASSVMSIMEGSRTIPYKVTMCSFEMECIKAASLRNSVRLFSSRSSERHLMATWMHCPLPFVQTPKVRIQNVTVFRYTLFQILPCCTSPNSPTPSSLLMRSDSCEIMWAIGGRADKLSESTMGWQMLTAWLLLLLLLWLEPLLCLRMYCS